MPRTVACPRCSRPMVLTSQTGPFVACPHCGTRLTVGTPHSRGGPSVPLPPIPSGPGTNSTPTTYGFPYSLGWKGALAIGGVFLGLMLLLTLMAWPRYKANPSAGQAEGSTQNPERNNAGTASSTGGNFPFGMNLPGTTSPAPPGENTPLKGTLVEYVTTQGDKFKLAGEHDPWADAVVVFQPGTPPATRSIDPKGALGKPDYKGTDDAEDEKRYLALGNGGVLVLEFKDNVLFDGLNEDLVVFEIGPAVEPTEVAISEDGLHWIPVGRTSGGRSSLDIGPFVKPDQRFSYVRLTDSKAGLSRGEWEGADIDAVGALHSLPVERK